MPQSLKDFKSENSPGTDGFQAEFYKYLWKELHADMIRSFNFAFVIFCIYVYTIISGARIKIVVVVVVVANGSLSICQRRGTIALIPKPNKDTTLLDNLRTISLLNNDYKILTKAGMGLFIDFKNVFDAIDWTS